MFVVCGGAGSYSSGANLVPTAVVPTCSQHAAYTSSPGRHAESVHISQHAAYTSSPGRHAESVHISQHAAYTSSPGRHAESVHISQHAAHLITRSSR